MHNVVTRHAAPSHCVTTQPCRTVLFKVIEWLVSVMHCVECPASSLCCTYLLADRLYRLCFVWLVGLHRDAERGIWFHTMHRPWCPHVLSLQRVAGVRSSNSASAGGWIHRDAGTTTAWFYWIITHSAAWMSEAFEGLLLKCILSKLGLVWSC